MTWDPAQALRGDVSAFRDMSPLDRARFRGEQAEEAEQHQAERRQAERAEKTAADLLMLEATERAEIIRQGYTSRELRQLNAENQARTDEQIAELEAKLNRIDPARRKAQAQRQQQAQDAATLMRARRPDEFMLDLVRRDHERRTTAGDRKRWQREADLARLTEAGYIRPEISR